MRRDANGDIIYSAGLRSLADLRDDDKAAAEEAAAQNGRPGYCGASSSRCLHNVIRETVVLGPCQASVHGGCFMHANTVTVTGLAVSVRIVTDGIHDLSFIVLTFLISRPFPYCNLARRQYQRSLCR